jgi:hypothetical protein
LIKEIKTIALILVGIISVSIKAQQVNTNYFMDANPIRHTLNPAFQPDADLYIGLPVIGFTQLGIGNNSITLKDLIYKSNGQTITFLNSAQTTNNFYNSLLPNTVLRTDIQTNILSFGFRKLSNYWIFTLTEKLDGAVGLPKDLFKLAFYGTQDPLNINYFDLKTLQTDVSLYTEAALGYSKKIDNGFYVGGKIKLLLGTANISNTNQNLNLEAGLQNWKLIGSGTAFYSGPAKVSIANQLQSFSITPPSGIADWLLPSGIGAGFDLGVSYKFENQINVSAAIIDLGFINWFKNSNKINYSVDYNFNGFRQFNGGTITSVADVFNKLNTGNTLNDSILTPLKKSTNLTQSTNSYFNPTTTKFNLGLEYNMLNYLSFGVLSHTQLFKNTITEEITASVNAKPTKWLNGSISYSILNGNFSSIGAGMVLKVGIINLFIAADYIPFQKITFPVTSSFTNSISVPYNTKFYNISTGINLVFKTPDNKLRAQKAEQAAKIGLKNTTQEIPADPWLNVPKSKNKTHPKKLNQSNGLHPKNQKQDCNCDSNI